MKRLYIALMVLLVCPVYTDTAAAASWDLVRNVKRLERLGLPVPVIESDLEDEDVTAAHYP